MSQHQSSGNHTLKTKSAQAGFTLIELLITLSIILVITMITRFGKTQYERSIFLTNLAYDVAIAIRETQLYGVNVKQAYTTAPTGCTGAAIATNAQDVTYGIRFSISTQTTIVEYADPDNDHLYDGGSGTCDQKITTYTIKNNNKVSQLSVCTASGCTNTNTLDITFRRPDLEACINPGVSYPARYTADCTANTGNYTEAKITVLAPDGSFRVIHVGSTGWISVQSS